MPKLDASIKSASFNCAARLRYRAAISPNALLCSGCLAQVWNIFSHYNEPSPHVTNDSLCDNMSLLYITSGFLHDGGSPLHVADNFLHNDGLPLHVNRCWAACRQAVCMRRFVPVHGRNRFLRCSNAWQRVASRGCWAL